MQNSRHVSLLTNGQDQVLTIPHELALSGTEVLLRKEGHRLIIEPIPPSSLLSLLTTLQDIADNFSDIDEELFPLKEEKMRKWDGHQSSIHAPEDSRIESSDRA